MKRLLLDAGHKRFDIIVVCKLDRFFRDLRLLLNYLHSLEEQGIKFIATQESLDTSTHHGKFSLQLMGTVAEFERARIGERVKDSRRYLISQGHWLGGRTLFGYLWQHDKRQWEVVDEEAGLVRRIHDLYNNERLGIDAIVKKLNGEGLRTREGSPWYRYSVRQVLVHPAYKGQHPLGITVPAIVDEATWEQTRQKLETARSVQKDSKRWLLQGMCFCGQCGHVLSCLHKKPGEPRYYACKGRIRRVPYDGDKYCDLPFLRADKLEWAVWQKVRHTVQSKKSLSEFVNKALAELEARKSQIGAEALAIDDKLESITARKERLGIAFADGAISESTYKSKLSQFKKQEAAILKSRHNIDPAELTELSSLESRISMIKDMLNHGALFLSEFGIFVLSEDGYIPVGFNAGREPDGKLAIGEKSEMDVFQPEGSDKTYWGISAPPEYRACKDKKKRAEMVTRNMRGILQFFHIKVFVYPDHAEIKGAIQPQALEIATRRKIKTAPIIGSTSPTRYIESTR